MTQKPSTNFLTNKYPHLSVVLIFKEQCRRSNESRALYSAKTNRQLPKFVWLRGQDLNL
jgi:hypothetical protein